jgi:hypothetical protein
MEDGSGWLADPDDDGQERYFDGAEWTSETRLIESDVPPPHLPDHVPELQRALAAATADIDEVEARLGRLFDRAEGVDPEVAKARRGSGLRRRAEATRAQVVPTETEAGEDEPELQLVDDDVVASRQAETEARLAAEARAEAAAAGPPTVESLLGTDEELEPELEFVDDEDDELDEEVEAGVEVEDEPELEVVDAVEPVHEAFADDEDEDDEIDVYAEGDGFDEDDEDEGEGPMAVLEVDDDAMAELDEALANEEPEKVKRGKRRRR